MVIKNIKFIQIKPDAHQGVRVFVGWWRQRIGQPTKTRTPSSASKPPIPPALAIVFGILAVSTASPIIRFAQQDASSIVIAAWRLSIATLALAPIALTRNRAEIQALGIKKLLLLVLSGFFLSLHFASWISSLEYTTVASSVVLVSTSPLWVALLSPLVLQERIGPAVRTGLLVALLGGVVVGLSESCGFTGGGLTCSSIQAAMQGRAMFGNLLALIGALTAAGYLLIGRSVRSSLSLAPYIFVVYGSAAVFLLAAVGLRGEPMLGYQPRAYLYFLALGLVPQLLGHSTFNWALRYLSAAYVSVTLLGEPIGSTILAYFFLRENPGVLEIVGGILILAGIYVASRPGKQRVEIEKERAVKTS